MLDKLRSLLWHPEAPRREQGVELARALGGAAILQQLVELDPSGRLRFTAPQTDDPFPVPLWSPQLLGWLLDAPELAALRATVHAIPAWPPLTPQQAVRFPQLQRATVTVDDPDELAPLAQLQTLRDLRVLTPPGSPFPKRVLAPLGRHTPQLEHLHLEGGVPVAELDHLPRLRSLRLRQGVLSSKVTVECQLRSLTLDRYTANSEADLSWPHLRTLYLGHPGAISLLREPSFPALERCTLEYGHRPFGRLDTIADLRITRSWTGPLEPLLDCPGLRQLALRLPPDDPALLTRLPQLSILDIENPGDFVWPAHLRPSLFRLRDLRLVTPPDAPWRRDEARFLAHYAAAGHCYALHAPAETRKIPPIKELRVHLIPSLKDAKHVIDAMVGDGFGPVSLDEASLLAAICGRVGVRCTLSRLDG